MNHLLNSLPTLPYFDHSNYIWALAAVFVLFQMYVLINKKKTPPFEGVPFAPNSHWLLGHTAQLVRKERVDDKYYQLFVKHADDRGLCSVWHGTSPAITVTKAVDVQNVLKNSSTHAVNKIFAYHFAKRQSGSEALVHLAQGKVWKAKRAVVHQCFVKNLEASTPTFVNVARSLAERIIRDLGEESGRVYDIIHLAKLVALDNFGVLATGHDLGCCSSLQMNTFALALKFIEDDTTSRLSNLFHPTSLLYWLPTAQNVTRREAEETVVGYLTDMLRTKQTSMTIGDAKAAHNQTDLASLLLQHVGKDNFSFDTVLEVLRTTFYASYTTTSIGICAAFWSVSRHPNVEARCLEEIHRVLGCGHIIGDTFKLDKLVYCRAVLFEALRMYPPGPMTMRILEKDAHLGGKSFRAGTNVLIPIWSIHRDPDNFPQPLDFIPERWVKLRDDGTWEERWEDDGCDELYRVPPANRNAFVAFSGGGRSCVGKNFATAEGTILLAVMLREIKMEVVPGYELHLMLNTVTVEAENGIPMIFKRRQPRYTNKE